MTHVATVTHVAAGLAVLSSGGGQAGCFWKNHPAHYRLRVGSQGSGWVCLPVLGVEETVALLLLVQQKRGSKMVSTGGQGQ